MKNHIWFGKYRIIQLLGRGGSADVYLAEHMNLKALRAIKRISKKSIFHEQLLKEAHILKNLNNSNVPIIYDFEEDAHNSYIIEQYIEGQSLKMLINQSKHFPENLIISYSIQICELLHHLYTLDNPILYLDLNPENIIVENHTVKLIDFGAAGYKNKMNERKYSCGTRGFAAPELYGKSNPDERADVYGLGSLLYFMVTGNSYCQESWQGFKRQQIKPYSKDLFSIIRKCLHYYPSFRYSTIKALKNKLLELSKNSDREKNNSGTSLRIAVAGTQGRIGTTHLAIMLTSYLASKGYHSLYLENNQSNHIYKILKRCQNHSILSDIYVINGCHMLPANFEDSWYLSRNYNVYIIDYGFLTDQNKDEFLKADVRLLVAGAKDWELDTTEEVLKKLNCSKDIKYLFSFLEGRRFREVLKSMKGLSNYRIPFEPNPFLLKDNISVNEFMESLLMDILSADRKE
jgi:serine/threonine-protein kinase